MRPLRLVPDNTAIDFFRMRWIAYVCSLALLAVTVASLAAQGLNLGIDFRGGVLIEAGGDHPIDIAAVRARLEARDIGEVALQGTEGNGLIVRVERPRASDDEAARRVVGDIRAALGDDIELRRTEVVGPRVGKAFFVDGMTALAMALAGIGLYVAVRFEWQFALAALLALAHDVVLTVGMFSLLGLQFDLTAIAALLTLAGYSINDTIVIFDRIRETIRRDKRGLTRDAINASLNRTLARTILTSGTTLLAVLPLLVLGGSSLLNFSTAMTWGIVIGTYSSIFVAAPLLLLLPAIQSGASGTEEPSPAVRQPMPDAALDRDVMVQ